MWVGGCLKSGFMLLCGVVLWLVMVCWVVSVFLWVCLVGDLCCWCFDDWNVYLCCFVVCVFGCVFCG